MSADSSNAEIRIPRPRLRRIILAPVHLQSYLNIVYLALTFPLGLAYFVYLSVGLSLGVAFSLFLVGIPLLLWMLVSTHLLAALERLQARYILRIDISQYRPAFLETEGAVERVKALVFDTMTYRSIIQLGTKLGVGVASFTLLLTGAVTSTVFLAVPLFYDRPGVNVGIFPGGPIEITSGLVIPWDNLLVGVETAFQITEVQVDTLPEALLMSVFGLGLFVISLNLFNLLAWFSGELTRILLADIDLRNLSLRISDRH